MSNEFDIAEQRQMMGRLARTPSPAVGEVSVVNSPGARAAAWAIKVKSNSSYNVYNVVTVVIGAAGSEPAEIGQQTEAVNLAESFAQQGSLPGGTYAVMSRVGDRNVFYAEP